MFLQVRSIPRLFMIMALSCVRGGNNHKCEACSKIYRHLMPHRALLGTHAPLAHALLRPAAPTRLALRLCQIIHQVRRWRVRERGPVFSKHAQGQMREYGDESAEGPGVAVMGERWMCTTHLVSTYAHHGCRPPPTMRTGVHHVLYTPHQRPASDGGTLSLLPSHVRPHALTRRKSYDRAPYLRLIACA
ncbi:hypothetical protein C8J57DRAFT_445497 [Mycena rebaudengoi]|nr:hypothetical protein C8J57DRAFT_445497 [Mycena rebaudengoi]